LETPEITRSSLNRSIRRTLRRKEVGQGRCCRDPAVANAVRDALGMRSDEITVTPDKILAALADVRKGGSGRVGPTRVPSIRFKDPIRVELPPGWHKVTV
jgi:hypothetical protein